MKNVLSKYTNQSSGLVELGAGYGAKIIDLSRRTLLQILHYMLVK